VARYPIDNRDNSFDIHARADSSSCADLSIDEAKTRKLMILFDLMALTFFNFLNA